MPIIQNCVYRFSVFLSVEVFLKSRKAKGTKKGDKRKLFLSLIFCSSTFCPSTFCAFNILSFDLFSSIWCSIFDNLSFRYVVPSTYCTFNVSEFDVLEFSFCPLDILSDSTSRHSKFWLSTFCLLTLCS